MKKILENSYLNLIVRLFLGVFFLLAAIGKAAEPALFAKEIANYAIVPEPMINLVALFLPWTELVVSIFLIFGIRLKSSAAITSILLIIFIIAVGSAMARGLDINCGCFSQKIQYVGWPKILENTGLLLLALYLFFFPAKKLTIENLVEK